MCINNEIDEEMYIYKKEINNQEKIEVFCIRILNL